MANYTLSYSPSSNGWTSFHSFYPDWMANLNNDLYTFKDGKVWKHNTNELRNNYYGVQYNSTIRTTINDYPDTPKMFKTISMKGSSLGEWYANVNSDLGSGFVPVSGFEKKEGNWYAYIRRYDGDIDTKFLSTKGIGKIVSTSVVTPGVSHNVIFNGDITSKLTAKSASHDNGDLLYTIEDPRLFVGQVNTVTYSSGTNLTTVNVVKFPVATGPNLVVRAPLSFVAAAKSSTAESYGLRGVFMDVQMTNISTDHTELFNISSEIFKSYA